MSTVTITVIAIPEIGRANQYTPASNWYFATPNAIKFASIAGEFAHRFPSLTPRARANRDPDPMKANAITLKNGSQSLSWVNPRATMYTPRANKSVDSSRSRSAPILNEDSDSPLFVFIIANLSLGGH